jgi:polyhydroxyalkanoate synthesis regulator phasin
MKNDSKKMPKFMREAIGQAQKRLTKLEGEARKILDETMKTITENSAYKKVEDKVKGMKPAKWTENFDIKPIRKKMHNMSASISQKAASTIGLATQTDLRSLRNKIDRLRDEVRKVTRRGEK